jgi:uncharacterized protein
LPLNSGDQRPVSLPLHQRLLVRLVDASRRAAVRVAAATVVATAALLYYTATHLSLDTSTVNMIDPSLPFRKLEAEYERVFPQSDELVVVIDGETADRAEDAADALAARLRQERGVFGSVQRPGRGPFFEKNGLLYFDRKELSDLGDHLAAAEPFLASVAQDPSLRGLFSIFSRALDEKLSASTEELLGTSFDRIAGAVEALLAGRPHRLSWQEEMLGKAQSLEESRRAFVLLTPRLDFTSLQPGQEAMTQVRRAAQALGLDPAQGVRVRLTGPVALDEEELESVSKGAGVATTLSFTLVWLLLVAGFGSARLVIAILATLFVGLVCTAAFATFAVGQLNLISVTFAVLFIGLGVDFGIQFGMRYREELGKTGVHAEALARGALGVTGALALAAGAAALGFFSFMPTAYRGLGQLGFIAGVSMFLAFSITVVVLPALLTLLPVRPEKLRPDRAGLGRWRFRPHRHRRAVIGAAALLAAGATALLPQARFDFNPLNLKDPHTESVATLRDLLRNPATTLYTIDILTPGLDAARKLAARLNALPVVDKTVTLAGYVPEEQDEKFRMIDDLNLVLLPVFRPSEHKPPPSTQDQLAALNTFQSKLAKLNGRRGESRGKSALGASAKNLEAALGRLKTMPGWPEQTLRDLELSLLGDLPKNLERLHRLLQPEPVTLADLPQDIKQSYLAPDGHARVEVFPKENMLDNRKLRRFVAAVQSVAPQATGTPVTLVESGRVVIAACLKAAGLAVLAASALLLLVLRRVTEVLLILLPLFLAVLLTVASSVLLDLPFNFANVIAIPLLLAIGVAFGIYFVMRRRSGLDIDQMFLSSTPRAVFFSALTTMASFGTLAISRHPGMASMGLLIALALSYALLGSLVVLPALMRDTARPQPR